MTLSHYIDQTQGNILRVLTTIHLTVYIRTDTSRRLASLALFPKLFHAELALISKVKLLCPRVNGLTLYRLGGY